MGTAREIELGKLRLGAGNALFLIAGPCVIESELHACVMAEKVAKIAADAGLPYIFKASYDKANRSSLKAFRGPGMKEGLRILEKIKKEFKVPVLTDIHEASQAEAVAEVCDILQIHGKQENYFDGARHLVWLPEFGGGHALVPGDAADRLSRGF